MRIPGDVSPENRFMTWVRLPDRAGVQSVVEEEHERNPPVVAHAERPPPASRTWHAVGREVQSVEGNDGNDVVLGQNGEDEVFGNAGDDTQSGGAWTDLLEGPSSEIDELFEMSGGLEAALNQI